MAPTGFADLVGRLVEAMGQHLDSVRPLPEGLLMRTSDGFVFAFLEDPTRVSLATVQRLLAEVGEEATKLVVLTPGRLPLALGAEVLRRRGTLVESGRFQELVRNLGLGEYLGEEPRSPTPPEGRRLLPSTLQLEAVMHRARTWLDWGVPALALRFFRQAAALKPEFTPARIGVAQSLLALGLHVDATRAFEEVLTAHPGDPDARIGLAAVLGASGHVDREIQAYRDILVDQPASVSVRAHLMAALIAQSRWPEAREELSAMVDATPEDPQLRYLFGISLEKTGDAGRGARERQGARRLGLDPARERTLCEHLGLPPPEVSTEPAPAPVAGVTPAAERGTAKPSGTAARRPGTHPPATPSKKPSRRSAPAAKRAARRPARRVK